MAHSDNVSNDDSRLDRLKVLAVFNHVISRGDKQASGERLLHGLFASHDFDGYTLTLYDASVRLDLFFHNRFKLNYQHRDQLAAFMKKIDFIYQQHCQE